MQAPRNFSWRRNDFLCLSFKSEVVFKVKSVVHNKAQVPENCFSHCCSLNFKRMFQIFSYRICPCLHSIWLSGNCFWEWPWQATWSLQVSWWPWCLHQVVILDEFNFLPLSDLYKQKSPQSRTCVRVVSLPTLALTLEDLSPDCHFNS